MTDVELTDYLNGTHKPVLIALLDAIDIGSALEIGMGDHSTPILIRGCKEVWSVEKKLEWYDKISIKYGDNPNWTAWHGTIKVDDDLDLVFVDGERHERVVYVNEALAVGTPLVVLHDSELTGYYSLASLVIPDTYARFDFSCTKGKGKATTVFTNQYQDIVGSLKPADHVLI